jgi:hypothetical protein
MASDRVERNVRARAAQRFSAARLRAVASPWTVILILTGGFQYYRGAPVDGTIFIALAAALVLDALGLIPLDAVHARRPARSLVFVIALVFTTLLVLAPPNGLIDQLTLAIIGLAALAVAWPESAPEAVRASVPGSPAQRSEGTHRRSSAFTRAAVLWAALGVAVCVWEMVAFFMGPVNTPAAFAHPTLSSLFEPLVGWPPGRFVFVSVWLLGGAALLRRGRSS